MARFVLVCLAVALLSGCGLITVKTNIPLFNGSGTVIHVTNASDYLVTLCVDGEDQKFEFKNGRVSDRLKQGESTTIKKSTWGSEGKECLIVAKAWDQNGRLVGVATRECSISPEYFHSDSWALRNRNFVDNGRGNWSDGHGH